MSTKQSKAVTVELSESAALALTVSVASAVANESKARAETMEVCKVAIPKLHGAGIVIGRRSKNPAKDCKYASAFCDAMISAGLAVKTVNNYLTTFKHAVQTGVIPKDWNKARKGKKARQEKEFSAMLASLAAFDDGVPFGEFLTWLELAFDDAQYESLLVAFDDYLAMHGEVESK
jgi:hypothetical protein